MGTMSPPAQSCADDNNNNNDLEAHRVNIFLHAENVRIFDSPHDRQLPVTIVTGYLGAGKTTLLRHILTNKSNLRIAAAINDFAELNIDENLIRHNVSGTASRIVELSNGCVCCHLIDDLQTAVWNMLGGGSSGSSDWELDAINYLVIETSGVSDPARIIRTLDAKFGKCFRARLDSVVTVVDADQMLPSVIENANTGSQTTVAQLQCADVIILNKVDLLEDPDRDCQTLEEHIRAINENAAIHRTNHCKIPLSAILDVQLSSSSPATAAITHEASEVPIYVSVTGGALRSTASLTVSTGRPPASDHLKGDDFVSLSATISDRPLSLHKLQQFVTSPVVQRLARMKGVVWIHDTLEGYRCILHLSGRGRLGFQIDGRWTGPPTSEMAFIGRSSILDDPTTLHAEFGNCRIDRQESTAENDKDNGMELLRASPEFDILDNPSSANTAENCHNDESLVYFRLTGSQVYGYTEEEIERDLRVDTDAMNRDLVDAINASVDQPKAFLAYTLGPIDDTGRRRVILCHTRKGQPANNAQVLLREAKAVLATHFRNVQSCKCGI